MKHGYWLWLIACCGLLAAVGSSSRAAKLERIDGPPPLVTYQFDFGQDYPFREYAICFKVHNEPPPTVPVYLAVVGQVVINGQPLSGGLRSEVSGFTDQYRGKRLEPGKGASFTQWGESHLSLIRVTDGVLHDHREDVNPFLRASLPFPWTKGMYEYRIRRTASQQVEGQAYTWVGAFLFSHKSGREFPIGSIRFAGNELTLSGNISAYLQVIDSDGPASHVPRLRLTFWSWEINGESVTPVQASAFYPSAAPARAVTRREGFRIVSDIGVSLKGNKASGWVPDGDGLMQLLFTRPVAVGPAEAATR